MVAGGNQWNTETQRWVSYEAGQVVKYDCGACHTTDYNPTGTVSNMPGIVGSWTISGITCERCHGPGGGTDKVAGPHRGTGTPLSLLTDPMLCAQCHIRTSRGKLLTIQTYSKLADVPSDLLKLMTDIDAEGGMIQHHEQFEEWYNSPHAEVGVTCHDPHSHEIVKECGECHKAQAKVYGGGLMAKIGVTCEKCHMAKAVKSAEGNPDTMEM